MKLEDKKLQITAAQSHQCTVCTVCTRCSQEWNFDDVRKYHITSAKVFHQSREYFLNVNFMLRFWTLHGPAENKKWLGFVKDSRNLDIQVLKTSIWVILLKIKLGFTRSNQFPGSWYYQRNSKFHKSYQVIKVISDKSYQVKNVINWKTLSIDKSYQLMEVI